MKRFLCLVLGLCMLLAMTGCGSNASILATGQYNGQRITVNSHVYTDVTPVGVYGFTQNCIVVLDQEGFFPVNVEGKRLGRDTYAMLHSYGEDGRALAQALNGEWVWLDTTGAVMEPADAPQAPVTASTQKYDSSETTGVVGDDGSWLFGVKDKTTGDYLTAPIFTWISSVSESLNYAVLAEGTHRNVMISPQGEVVLTLPDDCTSAFQRDEHIICVFENGTYRLADTKGKLLNETAFTSISPFSDGLAVITNGERLGLLAADGAIVIEPQINIEKPVDQVTPYVWKDHIACIIDGNLAILRVEK